MATTRNTVIKQAQAWIGKNEKDGSFKVIIDTYNKIRPLPRGYKVQYDDEWCATFVSAVSYNCGALDIIPAECSCSKMIELFQALGTWEESDSYKPNIGDIIFYDWEDSGKGENRQRPNHVGIVEKVENGIITVIEGNKGQAVARREIAVNGRYIRGYGVPKYIENVEVKTVNIEMNVLKKGAKGEQVKTLQRLLNANGCSVGIYGVDGSFGGATEKALKKYQQKKGLKVDGSCGRETWNKILKG